MNIRIPAITMYKIYDILRPATSIEPNDAKKNAAITRSL